jgi:hypothetical protein
MLLVLDNNTTNIMVNGTISGDGVSPMYHADNMEDGDHQLTGYLFVSGAPLEIDYFESVIPLLHSIPRTVSSQSHCLQD